jgi:hypothetical protein
MSTGIPTALEAGDWNCGFTGNVLSQTPGAVSRDVDAAGPVVLVIH